LRGQRVTQKQMKNKSLYDYTLTELQDQLLERGLSKFSAQQIFNWVYKSFEFDPEKWTNISKKSQAFIKEEFSLRLPKIVWSGKSSDGTLKFLLAFKDEQTVEAVIIPAKDRLTLCLSSQVGCALACDFCHTGTMGLKRNLETNEVVGQFLAISKWMEIEGEGKITNIVYMGQGEPLHNYENMKAATVIFMEPKGIGLGQRKITLSTSGMVPQIEKLFEFPPVNIAISLHSARDAKRNQIMPINKTYDLERLFKAIKSIPLKAHRRITYEYLLLDEFNNTMEDIEALTELLTISESKINLIPFNPYPGAKYKRPAKEKNLWFMRELRKRGYVCTIRATKGDDILAACGQLKSRLEEAGL